MLCKEMPLISLCESVTESICLNRPRYRARLTCDMISVDCFAFACQDTLRNTEQNPASSSAFEPGFYLVKLQFPIKKGIKEEIMRLSKDETPLYLPHDVYIASMLPSAASSIDGLEGVLGVYHLPAGRPNCLPFSYKKSLARILRAPPFPARIKPHKDGSGLLNKSTRADVKVSPDLHQHLKNRIGTHSATDVGNRDVRSAESKFRFCVLLSVANQTSSVTKRIPSVYV